MIESGSHLDKYCTDRQLEYLEAYRKHGSLKKVAVEFGVDKEAVRKSLHAVRKKAVLHNDSPEIPHISPAAPDPMVTKRLSIHRSKDGEYSGWHIMEPDKQAAANAVREAIEAACEGIRPIPKVPSPAGRLNESMLTLYTITDFHLGMYAWHEEAGDDWDVNIAMQVLMNAIREMICNSPDAATAILNIQGDFLHWDGLESVTPNSGHILDADTRYEKLADLALTGLAWAIEELLTKHKRVKVYVCEGNHDEAGSVWLRVALSHVFAKNKRVEVDKTPFPFYAHLHGEIMIGLHHGHKVKNKSLPQLFASEPRYREMWGKAKYTYIHTGHYHRVEQDMVEEGGAIVERHPTLAARDAYAARGGWVSKRAARAITYHVTDGEVARTTVVPRAA